MAWPYREYSEVFFGPEYKVLRGGSFTGRGQPVPACRRPRRRRRLEPGDEDGGWNDVPDGSLLRASATGVEVRTVG